MRFYVKCRELEGRELQPGAAVIDSRSVKAGPNACEAMGYDAGKKVKGRKRHILTDPLGLLLKAGVHSAGIRDRDGAARPFVQLTARFPFPEAISADSARAGPKAQQAAPGPAGIILRSSGDPAGPEGSGSFPNAGSSNEPSPGSPPIDAWHGTSNDMPGPRPPISESQRSSHDTAIGWIPAFS